MREYVAFVKWEGDTEREELHVQETSWREAYSAIEVRLRGEYKPGWRIVDLREVQYADEIQEETEV